jgi:uracil-DNA glycosylase
VFNGGFEHLLVEPTWQRAIGAELGKDYMVDLGKFLQQETTLCRQIYPASLNVFEALNITPVRKVKVVILGQDPYPGENQAHGLSFSVLPGIAIPRSLQNIYKELTQDVGFVVPSHGCLNGWAEQGVLLLNSVLTVEAGRPGSHQGKGWETFTDKIVAYLNQELSNVVFLLWGNYAQKKGKIIDRDKHLILTSAHPSPLAASRGFFGNHHFSKANTYLHSHNKGEVNWQLALTL